MAQPEANRFPQPFLGQQQQQPLAQHQPPVLGPQPSGPPGASFPQTAFKGYGGPPGQVPNGDLGFQQRNGPHYGPPGGYVANGPPKPGGPDNRLGAYGPWMGPPSSVGGPSHPVAGPPHQTMGLPPTTVGSTNFVPNRPGGLCLPPHGNTTSPSPHQTPSNSLPTSARSSCNPSPVPTQRYDVMEGQFVSPKPSPVNSSTNLQGLLPQSQSLTASGGSQAAPPLNQPNQFPVIPPPPNSTTAHNSLPTPFYMGHAPPSSGSSSTPVSNTLNNVPVSGAAISNSNFSSAPPSAGVYNSAPSNVQPNTSFSSASVPTSGGFSAGQPYAPQQMQKVTRPPLPQQQQQQQPPLPPILPTQPLAAVPQRPRYTQRIPDPSTQPYGQQQQQQQLQSSQPFFQPQQQQPVMQQPQPTQQQQQQPQGSYGYPPGGGGGGFYPSSGLSPDGPVGGVSGYDPQLHSRMAGMSVNNSFSRMWGNDSINLLQDRHILPPVPIEPPKPALPQQDSPNCSPDIFRCTLTKIPETSSLLQKSRLPFGILIHPFKDVSHLPVMQCNTIVRCRSCRTYINPFVTFVDQRRWKCNLCYRINDLTEEFLYDPISRTIGDPSRRPEIRNATLEFIAPSEYMLRPPQPAVYLFVLDVSYNAIQTGYLSVCCQVLLEELKEIPGDGRTRIGFLTFDSCLHFYALGEGLNRPSMMVVSDIEDIFVPVPDNLLVNLKETANRSLVEELLTDLPKRFADNGDTNSALGAALQAAYKLLSPTGGRATVMQSCLPNVGPGSLKPREDPNQRAAKEVNSQALGPASDFYKKLALDCSGQQVAMDLFLFSAQYADLATLACSPKYSAGSINYYPGFSLSGNPLQADRFENDFRRYLTRKIGFEAVMRIRCSRGLSIHTFHGNFFVRSTDLLSLPNVNPDSGFGMQIAIDENLTDSNTVCFQAAVLYTSSKGERRIRVHTISLPVCSNINDVIGGADQQAIVGLLAKMAVDRTLSSSLSDAREAVINSCVDSLASFKLTLPSSQTTGALMCPFSLRLLPLYAIGLLKHLAFRVSISTKLDERVYAMEMMKTMPLLYLLKYIYPALYPVHALDDHNALQGEEETLIPQPPILQLSSEKIDRQGAYLLDTVETLFLYVGRAISHEFCQQVLGVANYNAIPKHMEGMLSLPELETAESQRLRSFVNWILSQRPMHAPLVLVREDSPLRAQFLQFMVDDRTESSFSYYEFLQHLKQQISK